MTDESPEATADHLPPSATPAASPETAAVQEEGLGSPSPAAAPPSPPALAVPCRHCGARIVRWEVSATPGSTPQARWMHQEHQGAPVLIACHKFAAEPEPMILAVARARLQQLMLHTDDQQLRTDLWLLLEPDEALA